MGHGARDSWRWPRRPASHSPRAAAAAHRSAPTRWPHRPALRARRDRGRQPGGQRGRARRGPAAAPVGAAGPVRRLLRRGGAGLLRGRGPRRHAPRRRPGRHPAGRRLGRRRPRVHDQLGPEGARGPRGHAGVRPRQHRPDLPALGHAVGLVEGHRTSPRPRTSRARRSASGTSATSSRSPPAATQGRPEPRAPTTRRSSSRST